MKALKEIGNFLPGAGGRSQKRNRRNWQDTEVLKAKELEKATKTKNVPRLREVMNDITQISPAVGIRIISLIIMKYLPKKALKILTAIHALHIVDWNCDNITEDPLAPLSVALERFEQEPNDAARYKIVKFLISVTKTVVCYESMDYLHTLRVSSCQRMERVWKDIILYSNHQIISSLQAAFYMRKVAKNTFADSADYLSVADAFEGSAKSLFTSIESDHLATVVLEQTDAMNDTALSKAIDTGARDFIATARIQRILNSLWSIPNFLNQPTLTSDNSILNVTATYHMLRHPQDFFFTPVGSYITKYLTQFALLGIFSVVLSQRTPMTHPITGIEIFLWVFVCAEGLGELLEISGRGFTNYVRDSWNILDVSIITCIVTTMGLRITWAQEVFDVAHLDEYDDTFYLLTTSIAAIALWFRALGAFVMHPTLGPLLKMLIEMMTDIRNFTYLLIIFICAFTQALFFLIGGTNGGGAGYESGLRAILSVFDGLLGNYDFEFVADVQPAQKRIAAKLMLAAYVSLAVIVLFNLVVAMMASTYAKVEEASAQEYLLMRSRMIYEFEKDGNELVAPLNVVSQSLYWVYYIFSRCCGCCLSKERQNKIHPVKGDNADAAADDDFSPDDPSVNMDQLDARLHERKHNHSGKTGFQNDWHCSYCHTHNICDMPTLKKVTKTWLKANKVRTIRNKNPTTKQFLARMPVICVHCKRVKKQVENYDDYIREKISMGCFIVFLYPILVVLLIFVHLLSSIVANIRDHMDDVDENERVRTVQDRREQARQGGIVFVDMMDGTFDVAAEQAKIHQHIADVMEKADAENLETYEKNDRELLEEQLEELQDIKQNQTSATIFVGDLAQALEQKHKQREDLASIESGFDSESISEFSDSDSSVAHVQRLERAARKAANGGKNPTRATKEKIADMRDFDVSDDDDEAAASDFSDSKSRSRSKNKKKKNKKGKKKKKNKKKKVVTSGSDASGSEDDEEEAAEDGEHSVEEEEEEEEEVAPIVTVSPAAFLPPIQKKTLPPLNIPGEEQEEEDVKTGDDDSEGEEEEDSDAVVSRKKKKKKTKKKKKKKGKKKKGKKSKKYDSDDEEEEEDSNSD